MVMKTGPIIDSAGERFVAAWISQWILVHLALLLVAALCWLFDAPDWIVWSAQLYMLVIHRWDNTRVDVGIPLREVYKI